MLRVDVGDRVRRLSHRLVIRIACAAGLAACSSSTAPGTIAPPPPPPLPPTGIEASVTARGSGGVGDGITIRLGLEPVNVPPGDPSVFDVRAGTYDVALEDAPMWCEVDPLPDRIEVVNRELTRLEIRADCVGGLAYTTLADELRLLTADGYDIALEQTQAHVWLQSWAPDGRHFAFRLDAEMKLYELERGVTIGFPTVGTREDDATWSPDGGWVAWHRGDTGPGQDAEIVVARRNGSGFHRLLPDGPGPDAYPAWSPDGSTIVFGSHRNSIDLTLHAVAPDGTGLVELDDRFAGDPAWSHDGEWIAFGAFAPEQSINIIRADGSGRRVLSGGWTRIRWSPVANLLALGSGSRSSALTVELYDMDVDARSVLLPGGDIEWFDWSGDGEWIVFQTWSGAISTIRIVRKDGTGLRTVLVKPERVRQVIWDPTLRQ